MLGYLELFFGKSFTGKTARMLYEIRAEPRLVLVDPKCSQLAKLKGFDHVWPEYLEKASDGKAGWAADNPADYFRDCLDLDTHFRVVIHFRAHFQKQLELLCILVRSVGHLTLAVDELGLFIPSGAPASLPPAITSAMISGRHEGLKFCGTAQRPVLVHATARCNAERIRWYRITELNDLKPALGHMPVDLANSLPSLPDYVCVETSDAHPPFRDESLVGRIKILK
jgi:hypothetical protein